MKAGLRWSVAAAFVLSMIGCRARAPVGVDSVSTFRVSFDQRGCPTEAPVDTPNCRNGRPDCLELPVRATKKVKVKAADPATAPKFTITVTPDGLKFEPEGPPDAGTSSYDVRVGDAPPGEYKFSIVAGPCKLDPTIIIVPH
jgi:hypothetical protein